MELGKKWRIVDGVVMWNTFTPPLETMVNRLNELDVKLQSEKDKAQKLENDLENKWTVDKILDEFEQEVKSIILDLDYIETLNNPTALKYIQGRLHQANFVVKVLNRMVNEG